METRTQSHWWWLDRQNSPRRRNGWLQSTLAELDEKTKAMLRLIEEDADSFAKRAEMYYKKRPQLISMVEDLYRAHRSLAERFDQVRNDPSTRLKSPLACSPSFPQSELRKVSSNLYRSSYCYIEEAYGSEDSGESEVDDPVKEDSTTKDGGEEDMGEELLSCVEGYEEVMKLRKELNGIKEENEIQKQLIQREERAKEELGDELREEVEKLRAEKIAIVMRRDVEKSDEMRKLGEEKERLEAENLTQKEQLVQKDEEKREVIRQLSLAVEILREENHRLLLKKKAVAKEETPKKQRNPFEFHYRFQGIGKLFKLSSPKSVVPL
ncbi:hypothetical protein Nepgr_004488 [Nepenthes gracilis]|uniref:NAB domain-containing protein n=1 Tax=Nepenthes gracilis TaxID=150966 RepID=A0AAD3S1T1_NEPGR|nr:hypothetical protein Nepgr_004488 [Nepenthes gracilis]